MKNYHLVNVCLLLNIVSCVTNIDNSVSQREQNLSGGGDYGPYPYPVTSSKQEEPSQHEYYWKCGSEWIEIKGPDGKIIKQEIPLLCNPLADFYTGCPESNKKSLGN